MREIETGSQPNLLTENRLCFASEHTENKLIYGVEKETKGMLGPVAVTLAELLYLPQKNKWSKKIRFSRYIETL